MNFDRKGFIGTVMFHVGLLLLFLIFGFKTPLPLPGEEGILINFGDVEYASGPEEPRRNEQVQQEQEESAPQPPPTEPAEEAYITQDTEEAPALKASERPKEKKEETPKVTETKSTVKKEVEEKKETKPTVDSRAMYTGRKTDATYTGSEGNSRGAGNQGDPSGDENSLDRSLGGGGSGPGFSLAGRSPISLPTPRPDAQKEGKVVVEIKVNRAGEVVSAVPGVKGSTTLDSYLLGLAKQAALNSKFDSKADAPYIQQGTITYIFKLK